MHRHDGFFETLLDNLFDGVYFVDRDRRITYWNRGAERLTGYAREEVVGSRCRDNLLRHVDEQGRELCTDRCPVAAVIEDGQTRTARVYLHHKEGHRVPVFIRAAPIVGEDGTIEGAVEVFSDNSDLSEAAERIRLLEEEALLCPLTGLGNRRYVLRVVATGLHDYERYGTPFGILFLDVDHFKRVNDQFGHDAGDAVLRMVAGTLSGALRKGDTVGRWGGEEFVAVLGHADREQTHAVAERCRNLVAQSTAPRAGGELSVTVSVGATWVQPGDTIESLIDRADRLMYESKRAGRNRVTLDPVP